MRIFLTICFTVICYQFSNCQSIPSTRKIIDRLTSKQFAGRGYVNNGDKKAADYIAKYFTNLNLKSFSEDNSFFQSFSFDVNTFPKKIAVSLDNETLKTGIDFIVGAKSKSICGTFSVVYARDILSTTQDLNSAFILMDTVGLNEDHPARNWDSFNNKYKAAGYIFVEEKKLTWTVGRSQTTPTISILRSSLQNKIIKQIKISIDSKFIHHQTNNVVGFVPGADVPDSFIVVTAHYDHLGKMGKKTFFPGGNDNASGVSMMMNLATHYKQLHPKYTIVFIAFAGEEAGLIGSKYFTDNPLFPLSKIKFLLNLDLMGTGDEGLMVVNGSVFEDKWNTLDSLNKKYNLLPTIGKRGKAANSDHYHFSEQGVPCFFFYTMGGRKAYHDIYDDGKGLSLLKYKEVFQLINYFVDTF